MNISKFINKDAIREHYESSPFNIDALYIGMARNRVLTEQLLRPQILQHQKEVGVNNALREAECLTDAEMFMEAQSDASMDDVDGDRNISAFLQRIGGLNAALEKQGVTTERREEVRTKIFEKIAGMLSPTFLTAIMQNKLKLERPTSEVYRVSIDALPQIHALGVAYLRELDDAIAGKA